MHDRWNEIYQLMETYLALFTAIASIGSLIFVGKAFYLAKGYLQQHKEKIKEERRLELIKSTIEKIGLFYLTANRLYEVPQTFINKFDDPINSVSSLIDVFFTDFFYRQKIDRKTLEELSSVISSNLILLKRGDLQHRWFLCHSNTKALDLLFILKKKVIEETNNIEEKKRQFLIIPRSFADGDHYLNVQSKDLIKVIQNELTKMYHE